VVLLLCGVVSYMAVRSSAAASQAVAQRIRSSPMCESIVLVALTGWGQAQDLARAKAAGFDHYLVKPADPACKAHYTLAAQLARRAAGRGLRRGAALARVAVLPAPAPLAARLFLSSAMKSTTLLSPFGVGAGSS
jgi:CheY-like chemotaxis protein